MDNNEQNRKNSSNCADSKRNKESSFHESFQRNKEIIRNNMEKVKSTDLAQRVYYIDDPYTFDVNIEDQNILTPMKKNRKKKEKKNKKNVTNKITQQLLNYVFKVPNTLQLSNNHSNSKQSGISNINALKNKSKKSRQKNQNIDVRITNKGLKESINQIFTEKLLGKEDINTKYNVLNKKEKGKLHDIENSNNEKKAENNYDSDESILEVPVPPKPPPPVISLNDSDEDNKLSNKKGLTKKKSLTVEDCNTINFRDQVKKALLKSQFQLTSLNDSEISDDENNMEDIILNCTDICKGASSITEIREMSQSVQKKKKSHGAKEPSPNILQDDKINNNKNKSGKKNVDSSSKQLDNKDKSYADERVVKQNYIPTFMCSTEDMRNDAFEVIEENTNIDFTEDILPVDEFIMSQNLSSPNKKRQLECEHPINANVKRTKTSDGSYQREPSISGIHSNNNKENKDKSNDSSFFHPMSKKLRAFYTNSRGQENFDVSEVQSKMSSKWTMFLFYYYICPFIDKHVCLYINYRRSTTLGYIR